MDQKNINGYVMQLYQYARRYRYNNYGCLQLFNHAIDRRKQRHVEEYTLENELLIFGDFDLLQITCVDSFRKYHDVSELAKDWLGKRRSVLLYDISTEENPVRIYFNEERCVWKRKKDSQDINKKFFCLSMFSFTNEIVGHTQNILGLLRQLRCKILSITSQLEEDGICNVECEVFGTFNTSELGIIWLSDQYVDILQIMDYVKHIKITNAGYPKEGEIESCPAFFTSFSVIAIKETTESSGVRGSALVQIAVHDIMEEYGQIQEFARQIAGDEGQDEKECPVLCSVGEYDLTVTVSAARAIDLIKYDGLLNLGIHDRQERGKFDVNEYRQVLRNNIRLLYQESQTQELKNKLEVMADNGAFKVEWTENFKLFSHEFEWQELDEKINLPDEMPDGNAMDLANADYFQYVRRKLKTYVSPSAGAVDTLDLLYTDYHSTVAAVYNTMWVSDLHRQFKAVLHAIDCLITPDVLGWSWDEYRDLTNAFKQQIYHLTQANRMFFEVPSCHLRATGQYDFLMHAYYGVAKKILESIYLMQGKDAQSELILLITVNTVPQVKTQLYFEIGSNDGSRVINLDIPNSIIFNLQRGIWYLTHELFHYAAPSHREGRNVNMAVFLLTYIFRKQLLYVFHELLSSRADGTADEEVRKALKLLMADGRTAYSLDDSEKIYEDLDDGLLEFVSENFHSDMQPYILAATDELSSCYQREVYRFAEGELSKKFYQKLFMHFFPELCNKLLEIERDGVIDKKVFNRITDRIRYCQRNLEYVQQYISASLSGRILGYELNRHTWLAKDKWSMVREACSDIAMVSFNGIHLEDYMLFCIQAWTDASNNKINVLEEMKKPGAELEWGRYALVAEYFFTRPHNGWILEAPDYVMPEEKVKKEFRKQYIWYYAGKKMKNPNLQHAEVYAKFKRLSDQADKWLCFFAGCMREFQRNLSGYFDHVLLKILSDYDVQNRIDWLKRQGKKPCSDYAGRLEAIRQEFEDRVYKPYTKLFCQIPDCYEELCPKNSPAKVAEYDRIYKNIRFKQDIDTAHHFQNQLSFKELEKINRTVRTEAEKYSFASAEKRGKESDGKRKSDGKEECAYDKRVWQFHVHSLTELLFYIRYCYEQLNETAESKTYQIGQRKSPKIWFRGHTSEKYKHVPTVMRNIKGKDRERYLSLRSYQRSNFEEFKFKVDGAPEMPAGMRFTKSDYIAMMQHYNNIPTNFLDWTENAYVSLYLALKYYYENIPGADPCTVNRNVTLSIFHPGIYNHIRRKSLEEIREKYCHEIEGNPFMSQLMSREDSYASLIPNLSTMDNEENFSMFLLGDRKEDKIFAGMGEKQRKLYDEACKTQMKDLFMPMAVLTSRLNPRIRTQCGCFVAYHLYAPQDQGVEDPFDYLSLEQIQEEKKEKGVFLYQITIDKECCMEVVGWLKALGVSREAVYPELSEKTMD